MNAKKSTSETLPCPNFHELLLKELDERNQYTRFIAQLYITWYTFFVTSNLAIAGLSFANDDKFFTIRPFMAVLFFIVNVLGFLGTLVIFRGMTLQGDRMQEITDTLVDLCVTNSPPPPGFKMVSPYPHRLFKPLLVVFAFSLVSLMLFWLSVFVVSISSRG